MLPLLAAVLVPAQSPRLEPAPFVANAGQWPRAVAFVVQGADGNLNVRRDGLELVRRAGARLSSVRLTWEGSGDPRGEQPGGARYTWLGARVGTAHGYARVRYRELWPGIDLVARVNDGRLEFDLELARGADLAAVRLRLEGAEVERLDASGALQLATALGPLVQHAPLAFELDEAGGARPIDSRVVLLGDGCFGFEVPGRDPARALVVDPLLDWSSYLGGVAYDIADGTAIAADGRVFACGGTSSPDFPVTAGTFDDTPPTEEDAFVVCLDPAGSGAGQLVWATFLSGSAGDEVVDLELSPAGELYLAGFSDSHDLPVTPGAYAANASGAGDAFVARLSGDGTTLGYLSYLGGGGSDWAAGCEIDGAGRLCLAGTTQSADLPASAGALDSTLGGFQDGFLALFDPAGNGAADLVYASYVGGAGEENLWDAVVDCDQSVWLAGDTGSADFPTTSGAFATDYGGGLTDGFVAGLRPLGSGAGDLAYGSYLGGTGSDVAFGVDARGDGLVVLGGRTQSSDFPTSAGAYDSTLGPNFSAFVTRLEPRGAGAGDIAYSTLLHGTGWTDVFRVAALPAGLVAVAGGTEDGLPVTPDAAQSLYGGGFDLLLAVLATEGAGAADLLYASYYGGTAAESAFGLAERDGELAIVGRTKSTDYPSSAGAFDSTWGGGGQDGIVVRLRLAADGLLSTCDGTPNSNGVTAAMGWVGTPSVSGGDDFVVTAAPVVAGQFGLAFYSTAPGTGSWFGGPRCVADPLVRGRVALGTCAGEYADRLTQAEMASAGYLAGTTLHVQVVYRDPALPSGPRVATSSDLVFVLQP